MEGSESGVVPGSSELYTTPPLRFPSRPPPVGGVFKSKLQLRGWDFSGSSLSQPCSLGIIAALIAVVVELGVGTDPSPPSVNLETAALSELLPKTSRAPPSSPVLGGQEVQARAEPETSTGCFEAGLLAGEMEGPQVLGALGVEGGVRGWLFALLGACLWAEWGNGQGVRQPCLPKAQMVLTRVP